MNTVLRRFQPASWSMPTGGRDMAQALASGLTWLLAIAMILVLAWPLGSILVKAVQTPEGAFAGLQNVSALLQEERLRTALWNSLRLSVLTTGIVLPLALLYAFALTRTRMPGRHLLRGLGLLPLLAPSLLPGISMVYLFGNQGLLKPWLGESSIYGPIGIVMGEVFYTFPHALLILITALSMADQRMYEAAQALGAGKFKRFMTVTLPQARYGLVSAAMVVFTLVVTDFGIPKVIGGQTGVLATEAYKQVIGQQQFGKGAVIGLVLLIPALLSVAMERRLARRRSATYGGNSRPYAPPVNLARDLLLGLGCMAILVALLAMLGTAMLASLIRQWPYDMALTLAHYRFDDIEGGGWSAFANSLMLSSGTAFVGMVATFLAAYLGARLPVHRLPRTITHTLALLPMAVPGLVLGLGYVFFFNAPANPLHGLYGTMTLMVLSTVVHFFTTAYLMVRTTLQQLPPELEAASLSLQRPWWTCCWRISLPMSLPVLVDVGRYYFVSAMTTVSAVIFLYAPESTLASVSVLAMDDAGDTAAAAALATLIVLAAWAATVVIGFASHLLKRHTQAWRQA